MLRSRTAALLAVPALALVGGATGAPGASLSISDVTAAEGSGGTTGFAFTVQVAGSLKGSATVQYRTADGTAIAPGDYAATSGQLSFDRRNKTRTVTVQVVADTTEEPNETFQVLLSNAVGATIADGTGVGTILNDDTAASPDPKIAAAGDISCDPANANYNGGQGTASECRQLATSNQLVGANYAAVLALGDNQYEDGAYTKYTTAYDPSWGRVRSSTKPVPGNHEYNTANAAGYYQYFGALAGDPAKGYYSFDIGTWHLVALNSNCSVVSCAAGSVQEQWLRADLAAHANACTLAYWHHPRFSSGNHGNNTSVAPLYQALYDGNADLVLGGHDHDYERFAPQDPSAVADAARGIRELVVGTGGRSHYAFGTIRANSQVRDSTSFGILELTLHPTGYDWRFLPAVGSFTDSGSGACH